MSKDIYSLDDGTRRSWENGKGGEHPSAGLRKALQKQGFVEIVSQPPLLATQQHHSAGLETVV